MWDAQGASLKLFVLTGGKQIDLISDVELDFDENFLCAKTNFGDVRYNCIDFLETFQMKRFVWENNNLTPYISQQFLFGKVVNLDFHETEKEQF